MNIIMTDKAFKQMKDLQPEKLKKIKSKLRDLEKTDRVDLRRRRDITMLKKELASNVNIFIFNATQDYRVIFTFNVKNNPTFETEDLDNETIYILGITKKE